MTAKQRPARKGCGAILAVCMGLLVALILVEVAGRLMNYLPKQPPDAYVKLTNSVGLLPDPSSRSFNHSGQAEFDLWLDFNANGFRGPALDFPDNTPPTRILTLGDSYAAAWQVPLDKRWTELMVAMHPGWTTINLGIPGWGTDQEYLSFLNYPLKNTPDITLLMFFAGNDVSDNSRLAITGVAPRYPNFVPKDPNADANAITSFDTLRQDQGTWRYQNPFDAPLLAPFPKNVQTWLALHSVVYRGAAQAWEALRQPKNAPVSATTNAPVVSEADAGTLPAEIDVFSKNKENDPTWEKAWKVTEVLIKQTQSLAAEKKTRFMIVMAPYYATVEPKLAPDYLTKNAADLDFSLPYRHMADFAKANNIPLLDLTQGFEQFYQQDAQHRDLFLPFDKHFTLLGNCVAASLITNWLDPAAGVTPQRCQ